MEILNFNDCLEEAGNSRHLLLGNGFTIGFWNQFRYDNIQDKMIDELPKHEDISKEVTKIIWTIHPPSLKDESNNINRYDAAKIKSCKDFLKEFNSGIIYTLNYDLLLYWIRMYIGDDLEDKFTMGYDRFSKKVPLVNYLAFDRKNTLQSRNRYYLHGGLHIYEHEEEGAKKFTRSSILRGIKENITKNEYPIFVTGKNKEEKLSVIEKNCYLKTALETLEKIEGSLVIYGHSLAEQDDHIFNAINKNKGLKKIFISVHNEDDERNAKERIEQWEKEYGHNKEQRYYLYKAESAHVWDALPEQDEESSSTSEPS